MGGRSLGLGRESPGRQWDENQDWTQAKAGLPVFPSPSCEEVH